MICITVTPESRTLGKVDILNAATQGDIIEVCLDRLIKEPDIKELLEVTDKPIIISCRRKSDGGRWDGSEEERLMLLRQAIAAGPAYVELDLDIARQIPRFGKTQRVISFTRLDAPETDVDAVFEEAAQAQADVIKFTWPTPTLDDAWPLLRAISQKKSVPVVGIGLGRGELTFSLLGLKYGSPWIYAALERGMEAFDGQATVFELRDTYHLRDVNRHTAFIGVVGFGEAQSITTKVLNQAFRALQTNARCLPLVPGQVKFLPKMLEVLKIKALIVNGGFGKALLPMAEKISEEDRASGSVDLLLKRDDGWHGHNTLSPAAIRALESALPPGASGGSPLEQRSLLVLGNGAVAQSVAAAIVRRKGLVSVCGPDDRETLETARRLNCRCIPFQNLYDTLADVAVIADPLLQVGMTHGCINASVLRPHMTVMDVSHPPQEHELMEEARLRGCHVITPQQIYLDQVRTQFKAITGQELPETAAP